MTRRDTAVDGERVGHILCSVVSAFRQVPLSINQTCLAGCSELLSVPLPLGLCLQVYISRPLTIPAYLKLRFPYMIATIHAFFGEQSKNLACFRASAGFFTLQTFCFSPRQGACLYSLPPFLDTIGRPRREAIPRFARASVTINRPSDRCRRKDLGQFTSPTPVCRERLSPYTVHLFPSMRTSETMAPTCRFISRR